MPEIPQDAAPFPDLSVFLFFLSPTLLWLHSPYFRLFQGFQLDAVKALLLEQRDTADPVLCPPCPDLSRVLLFRVDPMPHDTPKPPGYTRFVCISDTHSRTDSIQMPYGDVFIHAGDFTELGLPSEVKKFNDWLGQHLFGRVWGLLRVYLG